MGRVRGDVQRVRKLNRDVWQWWDGELSVATRKSQMPGKQEAPRMTLAEIPNKAKIEAIETISRC